MASCVGCNGEFEDATLSSTKRGPICATCALASDAIPSFLWTTPAIALVLAVVPFFVKLSYSMTREVNGELVQGLSRDYIAVGSGGLALVIGGFGLASAFCSTSTRRIPGLVLCLAAVVLGAYQLARGLGLV